MDLMDVWGPVVPKFQHALESFTPKACQEWTVGPHPRISDSGGLG